MKIISLEDGITHINIYSKGKTELGRFLSNFANTPFECEDGHFESIEGYWYWLSVDENHSQREILRRLYGIQAKNFGRLCKGVDYPINKEFKEKIKKAIEIKLKNNIHFFEEFKNNTLYFVHYYVKENNEIFIPKDGQWVINFINKLKYQLNNININK